jgi:hypothetical protein
MSARRISYLEVECPRVEGLAGLARVQVLLQALAALAALTARHAESGLARTRLVWMRLMVGVRLRVRIRLRVRGAALYA